LEGRASKIVNPVGSSLKKSLAGAANNRDHLKTLFQWEACMRDSRLLSESACFERPHAARAKALAEIVIDEHLKGLAMPDEERAERKRKLIDRPSDLSRFSPDPTGRATILNP
jgi:hypothetical protein